ncbi:MAG TPA: ABC transporter ATP-binding protein [Gammaproteobacteria bacterium]|jgi:iron complex transport system ATP-binding protein|nr:ABC transporter ATP-binding protein [Gammaproteobacteria bacterium]
MKFSTHHLTLKIHKKILCENLNLCLNRGQMLGVLGPNGSGKTTLLQTLAGLVPSYKGEIYLQNKLLQTFKGKTRAKHIGILFQQHYHYFSDTVFEFCSQGRYPHLNYFSWYPNEKMIDDILISMDLIKLKNQKVDALSGGEKKRLEIATLLLQDPQIFLLDEPTNHLDLRYKIKILKHFQQLKTDKIIVLATHDIDIAEQFCDQILMLFPNGQYLLGDTHSIMTTEHLSLLYEHPMLKLYPKGFAPIY